MRTRTKKLTDYGVPETVTKEEIKGKCRNASDEVKMIVAKMCELYVPYGLERLVYKSLIEGRSYDRLYAWEYVPIKADDFYGYQRRVMAHLYFELKSRGLW